MFILVTGGSGSGKSAYAEERVLQLGEGSRIYLATMKCSDGESRGRIQRHRNMRRGKGFQTVERPLDLKGLRLSGGKIQTVLLECLSNLAANEMFDPAGSHEEAYDSILMGVQNLLGQCENLVVVTNEIFADGEEYDEYTNKYLELLGRLNAALAGMAEEVVESVCGIPICHKPLR